MVSCENGGGFASGEIWPSWSRWCAKWDAQHLRALLCFRLIGLGLINLLIAGMISLVFDGCRTRWHAQNSCLRLTAKLAALTRPAADHAG